MLLDAKPPKPPGKFKRYVPLSILIPLILLILVVTGVLTFRYWNFRQEHAVARFLQTLQAGNYEEAYKLWQPSSSYSYNDFLHDWGERGDFGKIRKFEILDSESKGASVIVTVQVNDVTPPLELVVTRKTLGLAYSPF
jgi:hypothetical protein